MALGSTRPRRARRRPWARAAGAALLASGGFVVAGCAEPEAGESELRAEAGPSEEELEFASVEEMEIELETIDNEIRGLEEYLAANPGWTPPIPTDPHPLALLEAARATRDAASGALAAADTSQAADSLRAAAARIEHVKRLLGVAEEMGIEFDPIGEPLPPAD